MTRQLARRTMKARRGSVCPACRAPITVGQRIGLIDTGWCHVKCILRRQAEDTASETTATEGTTA